MNFLNSEKNLKALKNADCFVLDMDGTFNLGMEIIPGAMDFYNTAVNAGKRIVFLTNNSSRDGAYYVEKLNNLGCPAKKEDVYTSGMATCQYVVREYKNKKVYLLGTEHLKKEFVKYGITLVEESPDVIVIGFDTTLDYEKMCKVCDFVREGLPYIATHPDNNCPTETGLIPDIGAMIAFIKASTDREPDIIIGKPYEEIARGLMQMTQLSKDKIAICGDRLNTDIATGVNFNILSICVLTGATNLKDIEESEIKPHLVFEGLRDIVDFI